VAIAAPLLALAILLGTYPPALLDYVTPSVNRLVDNLRDWTQRQHP